MAPVKIGELERRGKTQIRLICINEDRCVLVRRGKRIYRLRITSDGTCLQVVGEPPKKMADRLEIHLGEIAQTLRVRKKFLRKSIEAWASRPGVFQDLEFEIPG